MPMLTALCAITRYVTFTCGASGWRAGTSSNPNLLWPILNHRTCTPDKCLLPPTEAKTATDTKDKRLCRSYALVTCRSKNPHCGLLKGQSLSDILAPCGVVFMAQRPQLRSIVFVFSIYGKKSKKFDEKTVLVNSSCQASEVYDPFKGKCLMVQSPAIPANSTNTKRQCRGPLFLPNEFFILHNNSAFIYPHQKIYKNNSYTLLNKTLVLCPNLTRYYNKTMLMTIATSVNNKPPQKRTLYIITSAGFSLSIIALIFLLVTYFLFGELRKYRGKAVMHLSCAMIGMQSVYFVADPDVVSPAVCAVMGSLFHYFILVVFLWMSAIAHNTQKTFIALGENFMIFSLNLNCVLLLHMFQCFA